MFDWLTFDIDSCWTVRGARTLERKGTPNDIVALFYITKPSEEGFEVWRIKGPYFGKSEWTLLASHPDYDAALVAYNAAP